MYQIEAFHKESPEKEILGRQLKLMAKRLWFIITWPSAILAILFAIWLLILEPQFLKFSWMHVKLTFVGILILYHLKSHQIYKQLQKNDVRYSANFMRIWNEGATIILFSVVFLVILRDALNWIYGVAGIIGLAVLLMLGIRFYKKVRDKNPNA